MFSRTKDRRNRVIRVRPVALLAVLVALIVCVGLAGWQTVEGLTGYSYSAEVTLINNTATDYYGRYLVDSSGKALVDGGYIQPDGEDIAYTLNNAAAEITGKDLETNSSVWILDYETITAYSVGQGYLWLGNSLATRDQKWIGDQGDSMTVADAASLDVETMFLLEATVTPLVNPGTTAYILAKPGAYELYLNGTPSYVFTLYQGGTPTTVSIAATIGEEATLSAWYNGGTMTLSSGALQAQAVLSGTITTNATDIQSCQYDGYCEDVHVRVD